MGYFRGIAERYKDPVGWINRILFLVILCYGLWTHHWFSIIAGGAGILAGYIPLPREKWADAFIEGAIDWWDSQESIARLLWIVVGSVIFVIFLAGLWKNDLTVTVASGLTIVAMKLIALRKFIF
ncbi:MAG: hypothetical protein V3W00_04475 [Candidatus Brocadiales bacterium]